jgi:hypothetical protein
MWSKEGGLAVVGEPISDVQPQAQAALATSAIAELRSLAVEKRDGHLLLHGSVSCYYHKQLAQELVRAVCREIDVINSVHVLEGRPAAADERRVNESS